MAADVVKGLQLSISIPDHENAFVYDGQGGEITAVGYLGFMTDALPAAKEYIVPIEEKIFLVNVISRCQR